MASYTATTPGGRPTGLLVERDEGPATATSFRQLTGSDAEFAGWQRFYGRLATLAEDLAPTLTEPLLAADELAGRLRDPELWHDLRERPLADVVADHLADDVVRGIALTDGLIGTFADVHAADGLAGRCFLYHLIGNGTGRWRVPVGGMGAVSGAMAGAARRGGRRAGHPGDGHGARPARRRRDRALDRRGRRRRMPSTRATSCAAPRPTRAGRADRRATPGPRPSGSQLKVNMVLGPAAPAAVRRRPGDRVRRHLPRRRGRRPARRRLRPGARPGSCPTSIPFEVYCHSLTDPSILGPVERATGHHTLTLFGLHTPAELYRDDPVGTRRGGGAPGGGPARRTSRGAAAGLPGPRRRGRPVPAGGVAAGRRGVAGDAGRAHLPRRPVLAGRRDAGGGRAPGASRRRHPRIVAASSGGTVRGGAVSGLGGYAAARHLLDHR